MVDTDKNSVETKFKICLAAAPNRAFRGRAYVPVSTAYRRDYFVENNQWKRIVETIGGNV